MYLRLISLILIFSNLITIFKLTAQNVSSEKSYLGEVIRLHPDMDDIIDVDEKIEILASGFEWAEGPVWVNSEKALLFSDVPENTVFIWKEGEGISTYLKPSGYTGVKERGGEPGSNGLAIDKNNKLILCQHGDRRIARMDADVASPEAKFETLIGIFEGKHFNSPNDIAINSKGDMYFTDPPYGLEEGMKDQAKEIPFQGVYRLDQSGKVYLQYRDLARPNGIAINEDESKVYVANSDRSNPVIMVFNLNENGDFLDGRTFFDTKHLMAKGAKGIPDGIKVRSDGTVFSTGPGGVLILSSEGEHLGTIYTGVSTANCAFDEKEKNLYMTADAYLLRIKLK